MIAAEGIEGCEDCHEAHGCGPLITQQEAQADQNDEEEQRPLDSSRYLHQHTAQSEAHAEQVVGGEKLGRDPEPRDAKPEPEFEDQYPDQPEDDSEENVAADQRITDLSAYQATPGDDGLRPQLADEGLQRKIEHPRNRGHEQRGAERQLEEAEEFDVGDEVDEREPEHDLHDKDEFGEPKCARAITRSALVLAARQKRCPGENGEEEHDLDNLRDLLARTAVIGVHARWASPRADQAEKDRLAAPRARFDA